MSDQLDPINDASEEEILLKRRFTVHRMRETQPLLNAPAQDTVPGAGSGDS